MSNLNYDRVSSVQIILRGEALRNARREVRKNKAAALAQGLPLLGRIKAHVQAYRETRSFKGPHFRANPNNELNVAITETTVRVGYYSTNGAGEYTYPLHTVARVRTHAE